MFREIVNADGFRCGPIPVLFFTNEGQEPPHIHVKAAEREAKFWLDPVQSAANYGFNVRALNQIEQLVEEYRDDLWEAWNEHFSE